MANGLKTKLFVNGVQVNLNEFAHQYLTRVIICAVSMLKGGENVKTLIFTLDGQKPELVINDNKVPLSPFPRQALVGTITGLVSSLRGVDAINSISIDISNK
jgi:hypothetical protein